MRTPCSAPAGGHEHPVPWWRSGSTWGRAQGDSVTVTLRLLGAEVLARGAGGAARVADVKRRPAGLDPDGKAGACRPPVR